MAAKYQELANYFREEILAGTYESFQLFPTEESICRAHELSRQTVRHALALLVSEGLLEKRQGSGTRVRDLSRPAPLPQRSVAVITTYISDYIFPSILREAEKVLSQHNCTPSLYATQNQVSNERRVLLSLLSQPQLDGLLVEGTKTALPNPNLDLYRKLMERNIPLVFMNGGYQELRGALSVLDDNYGGGYQLVSYLRGKGHTRISGIFKSDDMQGHQRYAGYAAALRDFNLPLEDSRLYWYNTESRGMFANGGGDCPDQLLAALDGSSAVVCYNDEVASYLILALQKRNLNIPRDMAVVSFDNSRYSELASCPITSLSHGKNNVGRLAAETLVNLLCGKTCKSQLAPWQLMEKESSM